MEDTEWVLAPTDFLRTGSTLFDLALTARKEGGLFKGCYAFWIGDSSAGKTWLAHTALAEAARNRNFDGYSLIYDDAENGALMDIPRYFGHALASRLRPPAVDNDTGDPVYSSTIEEFYFHLDDALAGGPCVYVLDSMDSLTSFYEVGKFKELRKGKAPPDGGDEDGDEEAPRRRGKAGASYGDGKAKINSAGMRRVVQDLRDNGSILIVLCQTRDNIGADSMFKPKTRSGGHALKFYAHLEAWLSVGTHLRKEVAGQNMELGVVSKARVTKSRITGRDRTVEFPIYHSHGIDDVGACVDFLVARKHWGKEKLTITAPEVDFTGTRERLIRHIEEMEAEQELREAVATCWAAIEEACALERKQRYQ